MKMQIFDGPLMIHQGPDLLVAYIGKVASTSVATVSHSINPVYVVTTVFPAFPAFTAYQPPLTVNTSTSLFSSLGFL